MSRIAQPLTGTPKTEPEIHNVTSATEYEVNSTSTMSTEVEDSTYYYSDYDYNYNYYIYIYTGFMFEKYIYLYIWGILVFVVSFVNVLVVIVLTRKNMRNQTNIILAFIAVSDSLTGLITLPSYIMAYDKYLDVDDSDMDDGLILSKDLCRYFMISKFFLSKVFHTMSIFFTLFLGFERFVSVAFPFKANIIFTMKRNVIVCTAIVFLSPVLNIYHVFKDKAVGGMCEWRLDDCSTDCVYLWIILFVRHLLPCILLIIFTTLFIRELMNSPVEYSRVRILENRRVTIIVLAIVIAFLVPEVPHIFFLLYSVIMKHQRSVFHLKDYRIIHVVYEILVLISFHANFYIYMIFNKRFRRVFKRTFAYPVGRAMGMSARWRTALSVSRSVSKRRATETDLQVKTPTDDGKVALNTTENSEVAL